MCALPFMLFVLYQFHWEILSKQVSCNTGQEFKALDLVNLLKSYLLYKTSFMKLASSLTVAFGGYHQFGRSLPVPVT